MFSIVVSAVVFYVIMFILLFIYVKILQNKFDDLKHRVEAGAERFNQCEELAKKLIANESPYITDIEKRQDQLR